MNAEPSTPGHHAAASLLDWWLAAGVDVAVSEEARDWLGRKPAVFEPVAAAEIDAPKPSDLSGFRDWLSIGSGLPLDAPGAVRIAPHGDENAPVMLISDLPGREDAADGRPIGGEAWALTGKMLTAIGMSADDVYSASLACFHAPGAKIGRAELDQCAAIARDHVRLAKPQRLILFGDAPSRALLGEPLARARGRVHKVEGVRTIATFHPRWLLQRPSDKALAWRDLLLLMSEEQ
jgi:DNA polymerase